MGDKEDAVAAVEAAFHDAHRSAEKALIDATQLLQMWLKAGHALHVGPDETATITARIGEYIADLTKDGETLVDIHKAAGSLRNTLIDRGLLPPIILPQGGGTGKNWP